MTIERSSIQILEGAFQLWGKPQFWPVAPSLYGSAQGQNCLGAFHRGGRSCRGPAPTVKCTQSLSLLLGGVVVRCLIITTHRTPDP